MSDTGDKCHYDLFGWEIKDAEKTIKKVPISHLEICEEGESRNLNKEDLP